MYCIWFILNFLKYVNLVNVDTINRKKTLCCFGLIKRSLRSCWLYEMQGQWFGKECSRVFFCKWLHFEMLLYSKNPFRISAVILTFSSDIRNYMSEWFCDAYSSTDNTSSQSKLYSKYNRSVLLKQNKGTGVFHYKSLTLLIWSYIFACSLRNASGKEQKKNPPISME